MQNISFLSMQHVQYVTVIDCIVQCNVSIQGIMPKRCIYTKSGNQSPSVATSYGTPENSTVERPIPDDLKLNRLG